MAMRPLQIFAASLIFLSATLLPAQHAGAAGGAGFGGHGSFGGAAPQGGHVGIVGGYGGSYGRGSYGRGGFDHGGKGGYGHRGRNRGYGYGYGAFLYPGYFGYGDYWDDYWNYQDFGPDTMSGPPADESQPDVAGRQVIVMQAPSAPPASPQFFEVPQDGPATPAKPQPPALFVLQNGQQIESSHYVLSDRYVTIDVGRQRRTIPLSEINLDQTEAANRQRGLNLAFPNDSNSLFVSF